MANGDGRRTLGPEEMRNSQLSQWRIKDLPGMNNKTESLELQDRWVVKAQNCRFEDEPGTITKRSPVSYFNTTTVGSDPVVGLVRFYPAAKFVIAAGNQVYVGDDATGTFTSIRTLTTSGKRMAFRVYNNLLIGSTGFDVPFVYDGSPDNLTWELGSCKAKIGTGAGITQTNITYTITYDNDAYVPGTISNEIASATNEDIELSNIPIGPIGTVNRKIYRKDSNTAGAYRLVTTIANNTDTTYTDTTNDVSAGAALPPVTDVMPQGSILQIHRERLFMSGDPNNPNRIYYSDAYYPHFIRQTTQISYMDVSPEDNDEIMGIPINLGTMICIKKNTIRKVFITQPTSGFNPAQWYAEDPVVFDGSPAQWSIYQTPNGIVYLGWDHWYLFNGTQSVPIIDEFDTRDILPALYSDVVTHYADGILLAGFSDRTIATGYNNRCMFYNWKRAKLAYDTLNVNVFASKTGDDETGELYYGDSTQGFVYQAENAEINYRLQKKSECNNGTISDVFVGGTEDAPYMEIGSITAAQEISDDVCIFWDNPESSPGSGWTEITAMDGRFWKIGGVGVLGNITYSDDNSDDDRYTTINYITYRLFKKNNTTTEYTFPEGAIVMWDQPFAPTGYVTVDRIGYYIRIDSDTDNTGDEGTKPAIMIPDDETGAGGTNLDQTVGFRLIKKTGEEDTWDGVNNYVYVPYMNAAAPGNEWEDTPSTTYDDHFPIVASDGPEVTDGDSSSQVLDMLQHSGTIFTYTGTDYEDRELIRDGNDSTRTYFYQYKQGGFISEIMTAQFSFPSPADLYEIHAKIYLNAGYFEGGYNLAHYRFEVYRNGAWEIVAEQEWDDVPIPGGFSLDTTYTAGWTDVTDIKFEIFGEAQGNRDAAVELAMYEFKAYARSTFAETRFARKILGKMQDWNGSILSDALTAGTWTSPAINLGAQTLGDIFWNEILGANTDLVLHTKSAATEAALAGAAWSAALTDPNGTPIPSTADAWFQYKIEFTATDTTVANPRIYYTDGYVVKVNYLRGATLAEAAVEFIYEIGFRNFDMPMADKIYKKIMLRHVGATGQVLLTWETDEGETDSFTIDLSAFPKKWESFFQDNAFGRELNIVIYKNDLNDYRLKEINGVFTPEPVIL